MNASAIYCTTKQTTTWGLGGVWGGHATARTIPVWVAGASTQSQDAIWVQVAAEGHVWVHCPAVAGVYADVCGPWHLRDPQESRVMKLEDHPESAPPFAGLASL